MVSRHTSKKPEKGEVEGVHFFFVKKEVMQKMADSGQLVEVAEATGGALTGTAASALQQVQACMQILVYSVDAALAYPPL